MELADDDKRKAVWLMNVPLGRTHELRSKINDGQTPDPEVLMAYDPTVVAAALKLYFLELPGTSFKICNLIKIRSSLSLSMISSKASILPPTIWKTHEVASPLSKTL